MTRSAAAPGDALGRQVEDVAADRIVDHVGAAPAGRRLHPLDPFRRRVVEGLVGAVAARRARASPASRRWRERALRAPCRSAPPPARRRPPRRAPAASRPPAGRRGRRGRSRRSGRRCRTPPRARTASRRACARRRRRAPARRSRSRPSRAGRRRDRRAAPSRRPDRPRARRRRPRLPGRRAAAAAPGTCPCTMRMSKKLQPIARTSIATWPLPGCGSGSSTICRSAGSHHSVAIIARMRVLPFAGEHNAPRRAAELQRRECSVALGAPVARLPSNGGAQRSAQRGFSVVSHFEMRHYRIFY